MAWCAPDPSTGALITKWKAEPDGGMASARDYLLNELRVDLLPSRQKGRALADKYGLAFQEYEGGTLLISGPTDPVKRAEYTGFAKAFSISPEAKQVYEQELKDWATFGTMTFEWYSDTGRAGYWGGLRALERHHLSARSKNGRDHGGKCAEAMVERRHATGLGFRERYLCGGDGRTGPNERNRFG